MKLLAYTINGQKIGIDIPVWRDTILSGNSAFMAIADTGSTPTDYVDISSTVYWDKFGGFTTLTSAEIKSEIIKLIPDTPTTQEYGILEGYMNVGINSMTNIDDNYTLTTFGTGVSLSGITDNKLATSGDTATTLKVWEVTGSTGKFEDVLRINGKFYAEWIKNIRTASRAVVTRYDDTDPLVNDNLGGIVVLNPSGGLPFTGGSATEYWIGVDRSGVTRAGFDGDFKPVTMIYGTEYQLQSSLSESTSTSNTPVVKTTLTTTNLPSGTYKVSVGWIGNGSVPNSDIIFDVTLNDTPQGTNPTMNIEPKDANSYYPFTRTFYLSLSGANDIALRYWSENGNTVIISDATIELIRVS